ncbi:MAG TPA: hypothetical protein VFQ38_16665 [Longimicrobiales bacterium]|nr:hypothetical protein [Longimicrobiales bacterium]
MDHAPPPTAGPTPLARSALDAPRLSLDDLAAVARRSRGALDKYRAGKREMPLDVRHRLADFLAGHADRLRRIAEELRRAG